MGGRIIPRGEVEFRRHLETEASARTRDEGSDDTEEMETEPRVELGGDKEASMAEAPEDRDMPKEPEAWDSGS